MKTAHFLILTFMLAVACSAPVRYEVQPPEPLPNKSARSLIKLANEHIGEPYHYGGRTPKGWDCSGFVGYVYFRSLDIVLPRSAHEMLLQSYRLPLSVGQPGDLVFFKKKNAQKTTHVGIYMGKRQFIHVSTSNGVVISSLDDPYYNRRFICLGRPNIHKLVNKE